MVGIDLVICEILKSLEFREEVCSVKSLVQEDSVYEEDDMEDDSP
jgi:hypothetical protein